MARRKQGILAGAPEWVVTFADLMSLLVCFFVLLISFSIQDKQKLQAVSGSMKEAFGVSTTRQQAGVIELDGSLVREATKSVSPQTEIPDTDDPAPRPPATPIAERDKRLAVIVAAISQAVWQENALAELRGHLVVRDTEDGIAIQLADQDGRSMFPVNSAEPYTRVAEALRKLGPLIANFPGEMTVVGHASAVAESQNDTQSWLLTGQRAESVRAILAESGIAPQAFRGVIGRGMREPLYPDNPYLPSNRRIDLLLHVKDGPVPPEL